MFGTDVRKGVTMRTTAMLVAGAVGVIALVIVLSLAAGFGVGMAQAAGQAWPVALAAALLAGFMVELDRRATS
jgi:hypothetical protein